MKVRIKIILLIAVVSFTSCDLLNVPIYTTSNPGSKPTRKPSTPTSTTTKPTTSTTTKPTTSTTTKPTTSTTTKPTTSTPTTTNKTRQGIASYYADKFHGKTTANGEKYNMYAMTAAHKFLPFGTKVEVTNTKNGKKVIVRINDRMPQTNKREIDLSLAAARSLDMIKDGIVKVNLRILN